MEVKVIFGLGSNLGDRERYLKEAVEQIRQLGTQASCSPIYETPPWGFDNPNHFLNCCISLKTSLEPHIILERTQGIETSMGRARSSPSCTEYQDRTIDIDLLFYGSRIITTENLTIPHPHFSERKFVLQPLFDLAPDFVDPITHLTIEQLLENCSDNSSIVQITEGFC